MKNGFLFLLAIIIVIVSLSWFRTAKAQSASGISEEEKARITEMYRKKMAESRTTGESNAYRTPPIYDTTTGTSRAKNRSTRSGDFNKSLSNARTSADSLDILRQFSTYSPKSFYGDSSIYRDIEDSLALIDSINAIKTKNRLPEFDELKPFGMELFEHSDEYDQPSDITSSDDYVLGPGDNILINLWGNVEREYNLTIDRQGAVFIPKVGEISASGFSISEFTEKSRRMLAKSYSGFEMTVTLGKIRSIRIYLTGEVVRPGAYTVSSLTSILNALYIAGGPGNRGSLRGIKLMRRGAEKSTVDLYDLLLKGDNSTDVRLEGGDVVFVPVVGTQVAIRGEIKRAAIYELKGQETVKELLALAGNATSSAYLERIMLERVGDKRAWEVRDINLSESANTTDNVGLVDGDRITVYSIFDMKQNMVAIDGHVKHSGYYERNDSTRISDLIGRAQLQDYNVYLDRADLFRTFTDGRTEVIPISVASIMAGKPESNLLMQDRDSLHVYSVEEIKRQKFVYIEGEIERPGKYPLYDKMTAEDLIFLAGSFRRGADRQQVEVARMDSVGMISIEYIPLDGSDSARRIELAEDDRVFVRKIPDYEVNRLVRLEGEFTYPGVYTLVNKEEGLYHMLTRAGGFTVNAFPRGIVLERKSIANNLNRLQVPKLIQRSQPITEDSLGRRSREEVFEFESTSVSRIIIDIEKILATKGQDGDVVLEPGDVVRVPATPSGISVLGAVGSNGTIKFVEDKNVKYYVQRAGNFTRQSDKGEIRLMRAGGEVVSGGGVLGKKVAIGDIIVVPTKIEKNSNWLKTITTALGAATGVLSSVYIISKM
ncbi:MAG: SLBB domain-containing protein [Candidatus Zixiibacteriota bacterium]